ncbi:MAG: PilZ domain-containing protein [Emcibacteraceae bacterium]|nr:PilZ domain-containing protein [Emcibacteraceae bacterium]
MLQMKKENVKVFEQITNAIFWGNKNDFDSRREYKRRTVVWPAVIYVNNFEFKCNLYDVSVGGARLKLALPLSEGTHLQIKIKSYGLIDAVVVRQNNQFIGLKFSNDSEYINTSFDKYVKKLI